MINVRNCDVKTAIEAYKRGLDDTSGLYVDLTKYPPENFDDVRARTLAYMRIEDDAAFRRKHSQDKKTLSIEKPDFKTKGVNRVEPPDRYRTFDSTKANPLVKHFHIQRCLLTILQVHPKSS